jgi:hypothetical protein
VAVLCEYRGVVTSAVLHSNGRFMAMVSRDSTAQGHAGEVCGYFDDLALSLPQ